MLPTRDGGNLFAALPALEGDPEDSNEVFREVIAPLLDSVGFPNADQRLAWPGKLRPEAPSRGITLPGSRLRGVAMLQASRGTGDEASMSPAARDMLHTFLGEVQRPSANTQRTLAAAWGMSYAEYRGDIQREQIVYPFLQTHRGVPLEHTLLLASRAPGQRVTSVRGSLVHRHGEPLNAPPSAQLGARSSLDTTLRLLSLQMGASLELREDPALVLLPFGTDKDGVTQLVYAWRVTLRAGLGKRSFWFRAWIAPLDGIQGAAPKPILKIQLLTREAAATGAGWRRDPGSGGVPVRSFEVDDGVATGTRAGEKRYFLQLKGLAFRVEHPKPVDLISQLPKFDSPPMHDAAAAICSSAPSTDNPAFQQIHLFGLMHLNQKFALNSGAFSPLPATPWSPIVESSTTNCSAGSAPSFAACAGYFSSACPNFSTGKVGPDNYMNFAHDGTIISHELAHRVIDTFTNDRPRNWCGEFACQVPIGWSTMHDLSDAWADHIHDTNCTGGWVAKNQGGVNASHDCQGSRGHSDTSELPRLHELTVPFNPASPGDHFPERRRLRPAAADDYGDMQIAAAALWQVREGMRSIDPVSGPILFFSRFARALRMTGFMTVDPGTSDRGIYELLQDLELQMIDQWATAGTIPSDAPPGTPAPFSHSTNKVIAGFAKAGIFPIRAECLSGTASRSVLVPCPRGKQGAEAVIDIDDGEPEDDVDAQGQPSPDHERLRLGGPPPVFHVWTGARFRFHGADNEDTRPMPSSAPCHGRFRVEVSTDPEFKVGVVVQSEWIEVDTDTTTPSTPECYGNWAPSTRNWEELQKAGDGARLYYRARTSDSGTPNDPDERLSTRPGNGLWNVLPPFAVLSTTGRQLP